MCRGVQLRAFGATQPVSQVLGTQGVPVIAAPGEAEALMAALEQAGLADACATPDGDALVFGAAVVYHTVKLQVAAPPSACYVCICPGGPPTTPVPVTVPVLMLGCFAVR